MLESIRLLVKMDIKLYGTGGTTRFLKGNGIHVTKLHWPLREKKPNTIDYIKAGKIDLVVNIPKNYQEEELTNDYMIRRTAVDYNVPLITNRQLAMRFFESMYDLSLDDLQIKNWDDYV